MQLKKRESSSGNSMTRAGSFKNVIKTNHDFIYTRKVDSFLEVNKAHGANRWSTYE